VSVPWYTSFHLRFSYSSRGDPRDLHSFPTRLSSDLPLLDRMDVIRLSGYIAEEKVAIAKAHLWPKLLKRVNLKASQLSITDAALDRKSTRLNSSHVKISYAVFCLKKKKKITEKILML